MRWFTGHPESVGETYFEHQRVALSFALAMIGGGLACAVHAFLPAFFTTTGSSTVVRLHRRMVEHRTKQQPAPDAPMAGNVRQLQAR